MKNRERSRGTWPIPSIKYIGALRFAANADSVVTHEAYIKAHRKDYGPDVLYRYLAGQFVLGRDYSKALKVQRLIKEEFARALQEADFLVAPTSPVPAPPYRRRHPLRGRNRAPAERTGVGASSRGTPFPPTPLDCLRLPCHAVSPSPAFP